MMKTKLPLNREYVEFVTELKQRIAAARLHAARAVNHDLILLYWDIGRGIVERQEKLGWGQSVVEMLSRDLQKAFPGLTGFSAANLWRMRQFYFACTTPKFLAQAARELVATTPWGHHVELLNKVKGPAVRAAITGFGERGDREQTLIMPAPSEHKTVQAGILKYAQKIGWTYDPREEAERPRRFLSLRRQAALETKAVLRKAITANKALAELKGAGELIPNQGVLIHAILLRETKRSSEIENAVPVTTSVPR